MFALVLGRTKLLDPDVTSAFEPGSGNRFAPQQRIPDQLGIGWLLIMACRNSPRAIANGPPILLPISLQEIWTARIPKLC